MTLAGAVLGTPNYMSPEQVAAKPVTTRADIFSTGVILFEMLTGARPFMGENLEEILKRIVSWTPARVRCCSNTAVYLLFLAVFVLSVALVCCDDPL